MKKTYLLIALIAIAGLACGIAVEAVAQGGGGGFGAGGGFGTGESRSAGGQRSGILTTEQTTKINEAIQTDLQALNQKLQEAQKAAVAAALAKDATEATIKTKIEAVIKIQSEIALLKYNKGIKAIAPTITDDQKTRLEGSASAYQTLFGASSSRTMRSGVGGAGGAGGSRRGNMGGAGGARRGGPTS